MSDIVSVWDLEGNEHRVPSLNAHDLTTHLKWHKHAPIVVQAPQPAPKPAPQPAPKPAPVDETANTAAKLYAVLTPKTEAPTDLTAMSRDGLVRFAKEKFGMDFDANVAQDQILAAVLAEIDAG